MLYHFKLMDHFTGKVPLNLPFFFHRNLTKMCHMVQTKPEQIQNSLSHFGLIKMIIVEELRKREKTWEHFLFWGGFELETQLDKGKRKSGRKPPTPQSSLKKRRAITPTSQKNQHPPQKSKGQRRSWSLMKTQSTLHPRRQIF